MRNVCLKKGLVIGIIVLFLGVGFQPALANEISTNMVSDVDEDCLECQPVNRVEILKVKLLLIRIEAITNILLSRFGHITEVKEKYQELSDRIITLRKMNEEFKSNLLLNDDSPICKLIMTSFYFFASILYVVEMTWLRFLEYPIISKFLDSIMHLIYVPLAILGVLGLYFQCGELPPY